MTDRSRHEPRRTVHVDDPNRDVEDELRFHFEAMCQDLERQGLSPAAAAAEARRRFGDEARYRRTLARQARRDAAARRGRRWLGSAVESVRYAVRRARRSPGVALGIVAAFALGIGANAALAGVLDRLLLRPPPHIADASAVRLLAVETFSSFRGGRFPQPIRSYPELIDFSDARSLAGIAGQNFSVREQVVGRGGDAWRLRMLPVTGDWFRVLGVRSALGRGLLPEDDRAGAAPVVVISHALWRSRYGGTPSVLGQTIDTGRGPATIVGVAPRGFTGIELERVDAWVPLAPWRSVIQEQTWATERSAYWLEIVVRLAPGAAVAAAEAELTARLRAVRSDEIAAGRFDPDGRVLAVSLVPGESPLAPPEIGVARWLGAVSLVVLLVACINIANLLLAREARGRRDLGIRLALGISRARLAAHVLVEVLLLALAGGGLALLIARVADGALQRLLLTDALPDDGAGGIRVLAFTLLLAAGGALLTAALPALHTVRGDVLQSLRASAGGITRSTARLRSGLVIAQVTLSTILLVGAALFVRSFSAAATSDLGVDLADAWYATLVLDARSDVDDDVAFYGRAVDALRAVPGVRAAAVSSTYPFYQQHGTALRVEGRDSLPGRVLVHSVAGDYFDALGLTIAHGRGLADADDAGAPLVAVVNRAMAARLWDGQALGRCLYVGQDETRCTRVVGITEDARVGGVGAEPPMQYYVSAAQQVPADPPFALVFRVDPGASPRIAAGAVAALHSADARIRSAEVNTVASILDMQMRPWRLGAVLFSAFGGLALVVAILGLYGVIAFDVTQRVRELGLRAALGASPGRLVRTVLRRAVLLTAAGLAAALAAAAVLAPRIEPFLFGVRARDPVSLAAVTAILLAAAVLAAAVPGLRAARTDPNAALRVDN